MVNKVPKGKVPEKPLEIKNKITNSFKNVKYDFNNKRSELSPWKQERLNKKLIEAVEGGNIEKVRSLLEAGADVNAKDKAERTALMHAAQNDHKEIVELLINKGADVNAKDKYGWTALMDAANNGHKEIVEMLIKNDANVNAKDEDGWTALMFAANNGHKEIVEMLIKNDANVNAKDEDGWTALMFAANNGHKEIVELLLTNGADPLLATTREWNKFPAGSRASDVAKTEEIRKLIKEYEIKWWLLGKERVKAIVSAVKDCNPDEVRRIFSNL